MSQTAVGSTVCVDLLLDHEGARADVRVGKSQPPAQVDATTHLTDDRLNQLPTFSCTEPCVQNRAHGVAAGTVEHLAWKEGAEGDVVGERADHSVKVTGADAVDEPTGNCELKSLVGDRLLGLSARERSHASVVPTTPDGRIGQLTDVSGELFPAPSQPLAGSSISP